MKDIPEREELTVGKLFEILGDRLELKRMNGDIGYGRMIGSEDISRPGMALTGYLHKFLHDRLQIFGETEISYLDSLPASRRKSSIESLFQFPIYCCIVTKGLEPPDELLKLSESNSSALFRSTMDTTPLIHELHSFLDLVFAPRTNVYGSLVEVFGAGVLCTGRSAIGKSETVLGLIERGHRLIADDRVHVRKIGNALFGTGDSKIAHHMEIRGLGLIDVSAFYGIRSIKDRQQIHLEVKLEEWSRDNQDFDRTGLIQKISTILDLPIPRTIIPVLPGRNLTLLLEVAVMNYLLLKKGRNVPEEVEKDLIERIIRKEMKSGRKKDLENLIEN
ncbi:MAG: HPr(Ser) kinase/phosphatase [Candidatus Aegiribacteria sp.]|nr:HPr(Ser) kinase/phosphatase [Candidatus Aegiribacteria sp.]